MGGYEHDTGKVRTSPLLETEVRDDALAYAEKEGRSFSNMVNILLKEAIAARNKPKNAKKQA